MAFSFSFAGDDIEELSPHEDLSHLTVTDTHSSSHQPSMQSYRSSSFAAEEGDLTQLRRKSSSSAFPTSAASLISAKSHDLDELLATLPERISYSTLKVPLDSEEVLRLPRRELWDVRVQIMAEDVGDEENVEGATGSDDVKTGVYEGGFKSWESSVDLVRELEGLVSQKGEGRRMLELGCGTALPSLAVFSRWLSGGRAEGAKLELGLADYNSSVLRLVTAPNLLLTWAMARTIERGEEWPEEDELEIDEALLKDFKEDLAAKNVAVRFFSGAWGDEFVGLVEANRLESQGGLTILGAETIYSPVALKSFAEVISTMLLKERGGMALVGAKKVYFGVGGSMEDFVRNVTGKGAEVTQLREEEEGVRRSVVKVVWKS
jgi:hypothetical protein